MLWNKMACCQANPAPGVWGIRWVNLNTSESYFRTFQLDLGRNQFSHPVFKLHFCAADTHISVCVTAMSQTHISVWVQWWRIHYACTYSNFMNNVQIKFNLRGVSPGSCLQPPCIAIVGHMGHFFFFFSFWEVSMSRTKVLNVNSLTASISMRDKYSSVASMKYCRGDSVCGVWLGTESDMDRCGHNIIFILLRSFLSLSLNVLTRCKCSYMN